MSGTITIDESGQIVLPEALRRVFGAQPGARLRVDVTPERIEIIRDTADLMETCVSPGGRLVMAPTGLPIDAARAVREERDS